MSGKDVDQLTTAELKCDTLREGVREMVGYRDVLYSKDLVF